ncbi:hypothetical protein D3C75_913390 [compost metagenome]
MAMSVQARPRAATRAWAQQSGLFAGNGGYHVDVGHVNLIGGAISSTNNAVVLDSSGKFVIGFKLDPKNSQYENLFKNGVLR